MTSGLLSIKQNIRKHTKQQLYFTDSRLLLNAMCLGNYSIYCGVELQHRPLK